ncbi:papilin-like [Saccostrea cucullata]|uniref:papilin-like n=1 Tax=Saccostrea cuccullata TaxID=36930 RepID=UPI002ED20770
MEKVLNWCCIVLTLYILTFQGTQCLSTYTLQACYGNGFEDNLNPSCPLGQKIYVYDVYTYSKRKDRNCPVTSHSSNRNITYCCNYVNETEDCGKRYYGTAAPHEYEHYSRCSGRQSCGQGVQVSWNYTTDVCDSSIFMERSNYMKMWYNCLPDSDVISISNASLTAQSIFLSSAGYPLEMSPCGSTSGASCKVTASGNSRVRITGFDLQFSENSGVCKQRLLITDGAMTTDVACDDVNKFARTTLYTSNSSSIDLRLDNTDTSTAGKFWIHLEATNSSELLTVICQNSTPTISCNDNFTILNPAISSNQTTSVSLLTSVTDITTSAWSTNYPSLTNATRTTEVVTSISGTTLVGSSLGSITELPSSAESTSDRVTKEARTKSSESTGISTTKSSESTFYTRNQESTINSSEYSTESIVFSSPSPDLLSNSAVSTEASGGTSRISYQPSTGVSTQTPTGISNQTPPSINRTFVNASSSSNIRNNENSNKSSEDSALLPALGAMLASIAMAGVMFYLYWKYKKKSHLPVISSIPPAREITMAWDDKGSNSNKGHSSSKYEKEPTLISLKIHE